VAGSVKWSMDADYLQACNFAHPGKAAFIAKVSYHN